MKIKNNLVFLGILLVFGVFLLRGGITGLAVSDSGGSQSAGLSLKSPAFMSAEDNNALSVIGILLVGISAMMMLGYIRKKAKQEKQEQEEKEQEQVKPENF